MSQERFWIGTAGWAIPKANVQAFASDGSHLQRYARVMHCVEINSTFYRLPRQNTLARWAESTPPHFRFSVKLPKAITHEKKLLRCGAELAAFYASVQTLGDKLGPTLVQLPPKLAFDGGTAFEFLTTLREVHRGAVVVEPRHASWFTAEVDRLLREFKISRAMADPPAGSPSAAKPGGWQGLRYFRLHGSPRKYWSPYEEPDLQAVAGAASAMAGEAWIVFDNTAQGHAMGNALTLQGMLRELAAG